MYIINDIYVHTQVHDLLHMLPALSRVPDFQVKNLLSIIVIYWYYELRILSVSVANLVFKLDLAWTMVIF